jgi:hypothetical protein
MTGTFRQQPCWLQLGELTAPSMFSVRVLEAEESEPRSEPEAVPA